MMSISLATNKQLSTTMLVLSHRLVNHSSGDNRLLLCEMATEVRRRIESGIWTGFRNMSFSHTTKQVMAREKTVTRRLGWKTLQLGDILMACDKCQGLKSGERIQRIAPIRVIDVFREPLHTVYADSRLAKSEMEREGFPGRHPVEFVEFFCEAMKCDADTMVTRIEFEYMI